MNIYYVYMYLRANDSEIASAGTPYYIGKGKDKRAWSKHTLPLPNNPSNIIIVMENLSEVDAFELEKKLIAEWGRVDLRTGILRNLTNGGDGHSGFLQSDDTRIKRKKSLTGIKKSEEHCKNMRIPRSEKTRYKMKYPKSEQHRQNMRKPKSLDTRLNMSLAQKRKALPSKESIEKMKETKRLQLQRKIDEYMLNPKFCKICSNSIPYSKKRNKSFCSDSCSILSKQNANSPQTKHYASI